MLHQKRLPSERKLLTAHSTQHTAHSTHTHMYAFGVWFVCVYSCGCLHLFHQVQLIFEYFPMRLWSTSALCDDRTPTILVYPTYNYPCIYTLLLPACAFLRKQILKFLHFRERRGTLPTTNNTCFAIILMVWLALDYFQLCFLASLEWTNYFRT